MSAYDVVLDADSVAGHYKLNESSGATLGARVGPAGTYTGAPTYSVTGLLVANNAADTAISFPRPSGTVGAYGGIAQAGAEAAFDGTGLFSHECWLTPLSDTARSSNQNLLGRTFYGLYLTTDNKPGIFYGASGASTANATTALLAGAVHHLVYTFDGTTHTVYDNAVSVISVTGTATAGGPLGIATYPGGADTANVTMDEAAIYKAALSLARVQAHYDSGTGAVAAAAPSLYVLQSNLRLG